MMHDTPPKQKVLIFAYSDGYLEIFGESNLDVHVVMVPHSSTLNGQRLAEDVVELLLPPRYHDLYWPNKLRKSEVLRKVLPSDLVREYQDREILKTINRLSARKNADAVHPAIARATRNAVKHRQRRRAHR